MFHNLTTYITCQGVLEKKRVHNFFTYKVATMLLLKATRQGDLKLNYIERVGINHYH